MTGAKFVVKAGAQNTFLPPGAGYPSYATGNIKATVFFIAHRQKRRPITYRQIPNKQWRSLPKKFLKGGGRTKQWYTQDLVKGGTTGGLGVKPPSAGS